jgi:hypothetical protein
MGSRTHPGLAGRVLMAGRHLAAVMAIAICTEMSVAVLSTGEHSGVFSVAVAQKSASVACVPFACYGSDPYAKQCEQAKRGWEENKRTCAGVFHDNQQASEQCIHSLDLLVNRACTCAQACAKATCVKWRATDGACESAVWR